MGTNVGWRDLLWASLVSGGAIAAVRLLCVACALLSGRAAL